MPNSMDRSIAVQRGSKIIRTFRDTQKALENGCNAVIFPEHEVVHNHVVYEFQLGFVDVARRYFKSTGKLLQFVPMYIAPKLKSMHMGKPTVFDNTADIQEERQRICTYLMDTITELAVQLPEHKIIPYPNISKKDYPSNLMNEVTKE